MTQPKFVYSEENRLIGPVELSACKCLKVLYIKYEPYRTMLLNALNDYALYAPYAPDGYRLNLVETVEKSYYEVLAKSYLEEELWVKVGEVIKNEEANWQFSLSRIRVKYTK